MACWDYADLADMLDWDALNDFRRKSLNPEHPAQRGTAQNPDVFFQAKEASNKAYDAIPEVVDYILNSKTINLFGFGGSGTSANEFKNKFMKIMPNVIYNADAHIQLTQAALLGNDDLAIIFCNSGITKDCIEIAKSVTLPEQQLFLLLNLQKLLPHNILPLFYYVVLMKDQWKEDLLLLKQPSFS